MALTDSLVSYWKFDENTGTSVGDSHGSNTGVFAGGGTLWATGKINAGGNFLSASSHKVNVAGLNNVITYPALTVQAWVNFTSFPTDVRFVANSHTDSDNKGFQMFVSDGATRINMQVGHGAGNNKSFKTYGGGIPTATWIHVVGVHDGTDVVVYVDGVAQTAAGLTGTIAAQIADFGIGFNPEYTGDYTNGLIDEVALWSRALSAGEVTSLYNGGAGFQYPFAAATQRLSPVVQSHSRRN